MSRERRRNVERSFLIAIERILAGRPENPVLKARAQAGTLKLNISNVALEAGHSRTLIALPTDEEVEHLPEEFRPINRCPYPEVRRRILETMQRPAFETSRQAMIQKLRAERDDFEGAMKRALHEAREHLTARQAAERDRDRWRESYKRLFETTKGQSNVFPLKLEDLPNTPRSK